MGSSFASLEVRLRAVELLHEGVVSSEVARRVGYHYRQVIRWATLAGMRFTRGGGGGLVQPVEVVGGQGHGRRLSLAERIQIQVGVEQDKTQREIAAEIGCAQSTISRELKRGHYGGRMGKRYHALAGHHRAAGARSRPKVRRLDRCHLLRRAVLDGLNKGHSPQQIAGRLKRDFPRSKELVVCAETIYQALYLQGKGTLRQELKVVKALRSGRTGRIPRSALPPRAGRPWLEGALLVDRPAEVEDRAVPGNWEGDLVVGPNNSAIITLIERTSRFCLIRRLPGTRGSETVIDRLSAMITTVPAHLAATLTWDQGMEMAHHATFTIATGCPVFFCDPHSPWQRGSNENLNGLIRDYYPKGSDFTQISDAEITRMQDQLNDRPRMTLNWATPREMLTEYIQADALTA